MAADELTVRGLTGVDMTLTVAGPGTRSYAFVVDWHIRVLAVLAWVLLGAMLRQMFPVSAGGKLTSNPIMIALMVGAGLTYFLYHPVLEVAMRGRTPGKRIAGVRIATVEGEMPGAGALLMRNLFRLIDSLPSLYLLGLVCCLVTRQSVRIGDMAAGTVLVLDAEDSAGSLGRLSALLERSSLPPEILKLVQDLLDRWKALQKPQRLTLARTLLARIEPQRDAAGLAALDEAALRTLLESHVGSGRR
ncbi:MAG: RDD family protein [Steroidobacteraceae bacterium]